MTQDKAKVILRSGKDDAVRRFHPWVFSGAIKKIQGPVHEGAMVQVFSNRDEYLGSGIYQDATIAVRILAFAPHQPDTFDHAFWKEKLENAYSLRQSTGLAENPETNAYRLVHGEGDHLPGLIIDHYNGHLVIQVHATGLYQYLPEITGALREIFGENLKSIYDKSRDTLPKGFAANEGEQACLFGKPEAVVVKEYGKLFRVDPPKGQKTGFFLDQRENRNLLTQYSKDKKVLNTFCYSGGFSVFALKAGASLVHSLDSSARAIDLTEENIQLNFGDEVKHASICEDTMQYLRRTEETYDVIILDPPAYAKHSHVRHNAVQGYKRLNLEALQKIRSGGVLFTFSCSQVVDKNLFRNTVMAAAIQAGRSVRILHQLSQPADHPVNIFHPEGEYLKGLVLFVE